MPPSVMRPLTAAGSVLSQIANSVASLACLDLAATAVEEPPQLPVLCSPALHCGSSAMAHLPAVSGALPDSTPGPQTALGQAMRVPSLRALFHSGVYIGCLSMSPEATRPPQKSATFFVASSSTLTLHVSPETPNHLAPACCDSPANQPGSPAENVVRYRFGSFWRTC